MQHTQHPYCNQFWICIKHSFCLHTDRNTQLLPNMQTEHFTVCKQISSFIVFTYSLSVFGSDAGGAWFPEIMGICVKYQSKLQFSKYFARILAGCASCVLELTKAWLVSQIMYTSISVDGVDWNIVNWKTLLGFSVCKFLCAFRCLAKKRPASAIGCC